MNWDRNCNQHQCTGIYEFIGCQGMLNSEIVIHQWFDEKPILKSNEPLILLYKCSRCGELRRRMNQGYEIHIKKERELLRQTDILVLQNS